MYPNGITHLAVQDDLGGIVEIVKWLSYIPARTGVPAPIYQGVVDDPERDIAFPLGGKYDARQMLAGRLSSKQLFYIYLFFFFIFSPQYLQRVQSRHGWEDSSIVIHSWKLSQDGVRQLSQAVRVSEEFPWA